MSEMKLYSTRLLMARPTITIKASTEGPRTIGDSGWRRVNSDSFSRPGSAGRSGRPIQLTVDRDPEPRRRARRFGLLSGSYGVFWFALLLTAFVQEVFAAQWYVEKGASGANNGTSWIDAWTAFANVTWA